MALITNTTPINAGITWTSSVQSLNRATQITGSVFADQPGVFTVAQGGDGTHFDAVTNVTITANVGVAIEVDVVSQFFEVKFNNTSSTNQTALRVFIDIRDPYGDFLAAALSPSPGGAWAVLFQGSNGYQFVGRFDGADALSANGSAAISQNKSGQYASFPVSDATVSIETLIPTTEHALASF